jgi:hypothetical protein
LLFFGSAEIEKRTTWKKEQEKKENRQTLFVVFLPKKSFQYLWKKWFFIVAQNKKFFHPLLKDKETAYSRSKIQ